MLTTAALAVAVPATANAAAPGVAAAPYPSDSAQPNLATVLGGYSAYWAPNGAGNLHGKVLNKKIAQRDDMLAVWINGNATKAQQFKALQDSTYQNDAGTQYDQSMTISTGLGSVLGPLYVRGRNSGALPLTSALINSTNGSSGAYLNVGTVKNGFSHPRPYLPSNANAAPVAGDEAACAPSLINGSSLKSIRVGKSYATATGNLKIKRVPAVVDTTHKFSPNDVSLGAGYGAIGLCSGGSFPSGHGTTVYEAGFTLATLLPELAPEILARTSEVGNSRMVLGVHYPTDIMGGRMAGEAALAARWSDTKYRTEVLVPARTELVNFLKKGCAKTLAKCIAGQKAYTSNPYGGKKMPSGTAQVVTGRKSAVKVYRELMTYGYPRTGKKLAASVPAGAANLLLTTFPTLTTAQRTSVLAQTQAASGYPLDRTGTKGKSWQRLNLAAAMSATVKHLAKGKVKVVSTGGKAKVL
ncbi:MAG TPA: phosphatase PAP2 family protein [Kineosporiaceae bacterium]|nr:phosphatase PAP2 family protein [Kineosporiaceae bacterium]